jgi:hypothetical protein
MDAHEYQTWVANRRPSFIGMRAQDGQTKSLLFGIQLGHGGEGVHLFQHKGKLHLVRFRSPTPEERQEHGVDVVVTAEHIDEVLRSNLLSGNERWMAELCDFEFCSILDKSGVQLEIFPYRGAKNLTALAAEGRLAGYTHVSELESDVDFRAIKLSGSAFPIE